MQMHVKYIPFLRRLLKQMIRKNRSKRTKLRRPEDLNSCSSFDWSNPLPVSSCLRQPRLQQFGTVLLQQSENNFSSGFRCILNFVEKCIWDPYEVFSKPSYDLKALAILFINPSIVVYTKGKPELISFLYMRHVKIVSKDTIWLEHFVFVYFIHKKVEDIFG